MMKKLPNNKHFTIILLFIENEKGTFLQQKTSKEKHSSIKTMGRHMTYKNSTIETVIKEGKEKLDINISKNDIIQIDTMLIKIFL